MTTNKPGIKIYEPSEKGVTAMRKASFRNTGPDRYVRLSDYEALQAECEKLRKDAERYRWIRDGNNEESAKELSIDVHHYGSTLDGMIDVTMGGWRGIMNYSEKIAGLKEIKAVLDKHKDIVTGTSLDVSDSVEGLIELAKLSQIFGFDINPRYSGEGSALNGWVKLSYNGSHATEVLLLMGEKHLRTISWSDDGRQPVDEWLYSISFSTGAYFFGSHYPEDLFDEFFDELKTFNPKYSDTVNHALYFSPENASKVKEALGGIIKKYRDMAGEDFRRMKVEELEEEINKLKEEINETRSR